MLRKKGLVFNCGSRMIMIDKNYEAILKELRTIQSDIRQISTKLIVVADWVRLKCRYGCRAYGKHLCCPPYAPTPEETRRVISEYTNAVLVRFEARPNKDLLPEHTHHALWNSLTSMHQIIYELERKAFLCGYYKAFGMGPLPCTLCDICITEEKLGKDETIYLLDTIKCRHKDIMRPSMEACGIDVFKTLENAGYNLKILKDYAECLVLFGLVLID